MSLATLVDAVRTHLEARLTPVPALIGGAQPIEAGDLPAVSVSVSGVVQRLRGVGRLPTPVMTGALRIETDVDVANPIATFPDGAVNLLSPDRRSFQIPHGAIVRSDGSSFGPFGPLDLEVRLDATSFAVVSSAPVAGQVQPDPDTGQLLFGAPLPGTGTLHLAYFVGQWEVRTVRYQGMLRLDAFAADAAGVETLSRQIEAALGPIGPGDSVPGFNSLEPDAWGAVGPADPAAADARSRAVLYRFDYELIEPLVLSGGGVISTVAISSILQAETGEVVEEFDITGEGSGT